MKQTIDAFVADKKIAIAGVSRNQNKWGNNLMDELKKLGYEVYPINPHTNSINNVKCFRSVNELPEDVTSLIVATRPAATDLLVREIPGSNIKRIWIQKGVGKGSYSDKAYNYLKAQNVDLVYGLCPMMFFDGKGIHRFHYKLRRLFGGVPEGVE